MTVSSDLTKLGSPSALSLFASAETIPSLVTAGAVLAVSAALFTYAEFKSYQEKKHKKKIEEINGLYTAHLKQIVVPNIGKIHGFPPIFQIVGEHYQSMHFTPEQVKEIGTEIPRGTDIALASYRESIRAALRKLKEYYFSRLKGGGGESKANDISAGVISYLMQMIETKCLNFLGYDYDIAYLNAICKFINAYSSQKNTEKSQRFSRLAPAYMHLLKAKQKLEKHKEVLSLQDTIAELKDSCVNHSDNLIRMLVKMVVKDADTELADTVAHEELKEGIVRQHYIHSEVLGIALSTDKEICIPESIFREWIENLSNYYLESLGTELKQGNQIYSPNSFFALLNQAKNMNSRRSFAKSKEQERITCELKRIQRVFNDSGNFISSRYNKLTKKFETVKDPLHLIDRSLVMAQVAKLTHEIISLQYLCTHLLKSIQLLGDIYVSDPKHFCKIFGVLERLCNLIQEDVKNNKKAFREIQEDNENKMQIEEKEAFPNQLKDIFDLVGAEIKNLGDQVRECRQIAIKTASQNKIKSTKYEMLEIATMLSKMYFDDYELNVEESESSGSESDESPQKADELKTNANINTTLDELKDILLHRILEIQKDELYRATAYFKIYDALSVMRTKALALISEQQTPFERQEKATKTAELTVSLFQETIVFLNKPTAVRQAGAQQFFTKIHHQLNNENSNSFIDRHQNKASKYIYTHLCDKGIFRTDTRKKLAAFEDACLRATG
ncbi:MAG: hypothetical protein QM652_08410 [Legionella sp.]|uniref:hypothetical protein n=1 Tax=Legionella sp. TaxID=459 RepID=UPI0039E6DEC8